MANNPNATKNLKPFTKGTDKRRNTKGRPPGVKNLSTVIQMILGDPKLVEKIYDVKPGWLELLPTRNGAEAVSGAMLARALSGDVRAADWLAKRGYGDKINILNGDDRPLQPVWFIDLDPPELVNPPKPKPKAKPKRKAASNAPRSIQRKAAAGVKPSSKPQSK